MLLPTWLTPLSMAQRWEGKKLNDFKCFRQMADAYQRPGEFNNQTFLDQQYAQMMNTELMSKCSSY